MSAPVVEAEINEAAQRLGQMSRDEYWSLEHAHYVLARSTDRGKLMDPTLQAAAKRIRDCQQAICEAEKIL